MGTSLVATGRETESGAHRRWRGARRPTPVSPARVAWETLLVSFAALAYFFVRGLMDGQWSTAMANASALMELERRIGLDWERTMQSWILGSDRMVTLANRIYIFWHWPVIAATLVWMITGHSDRFGLYRTALLVSGAIGLVCFLLLPMAPPRLMPEYGFVDTVTQHSEAYRVLQPPALTNPYAAMPSLHVGWNLLMGIAIARHATTRWARAMGWVMPLVMWVATVVTANHYILDGVVGSTVALIGLGIATWLRMLQSERVDRRRTGAYDTLLYT